MSDRADKAAPLTPPSILMGGLHLAAFWALAIVQPLLNLLGNNPDFFVARDNTSGQIILFVLLLMLLPPLLATLIEALVNLASPAARWIVHLGFCGVLLAAFSLQILKQFADGPAWPMIILACLLGGLLTWAYARARFVRSMSDILIVAPLVILISFFFFSDASELTTSTPEVHAKEITASNPAPVVMVIFDEFPAGSLMTPSGNINPRRFPTFARLKDTSTWYRNTATDASYTAIAVPSILTGKAADRDSLPTAADHPDSIFTLLGNDWKTQAIEPITQLCTEEICGEREGVNTDTGDAIHSLYTDLKAVSAHLLLPADMGSSLPDISQSFEGFGGTEEDSIERGRARQWVHDRLVEDGPSLDGEGDVAKFIDTLPSTGQTFDFVHVEKPHYPWTHYPSGLKYSDGTEDFRNFITDTDWLGDEYMTDRARQAHLLEVGFTDNLLGRIIGALKRDGRWDETLFVATADHGAAWTKDSNRREAEPGTMGQIGMVPLFIKAPGQKQGEIVDRPTCTTEIVPEMANILGIDLPWTPADCDRETIRIDNGSGPRTTLSFAKTMKQRQAYIDEMADLFGGDGAPWLRAFEWGDFSALIGMNSNRLWRVGNSATSQASARPENASSGFDPELELNPVLRQRGTITGLDSGVPLAVAVNGRVAAVGQTYEDLGKVRYSILLPETSLRPGENEIALFEVVPALGGSDTSAALTRLWSSSDQ
ncbi:MAG: sulfatase-like hydrolase/transferase [Solirubrobacterales bacterium]|nr:sulfatase-like hydrolase/transferase [Solirubrobacterales bacterium]